MNPRILNQDFQHPADGWYQIEALGHHPHRASGVIQVIDAQAAASMVNRFNADAAAGQLRHGREMLIDHEHFSDQPDQETRAYGWLQELQNRSNLDVAPGIYGRIRWTSTGKAAVDGGDYRFFSTEYAPADLKVLNGGANGGAHRDAATPKQVRPMRLGGLSLTNMNNNRGQKPITNRGLGLGSWFRGLGSGKSPDARPHSPNSNFAGSGETAEKPQTKNQNMNNIARALGLAAEASEDSILAALTKIQNRVAELEPLAADNTKLKNRLKQMDDDAVAALLESRGVKDEKVKNRLTPVLAALPTLDERTAALDDLGFTGTHGQDARATVRVLNRGAGAPRETRAVTGGESDQALAVKIQNRASELQAKGMKYDQAWNQAQREVYAK